MWWALLDAVYTSTHGGSFKSTVKIWHVVKVYVNSNKHSFHFIICLFNL